MQAHKLIALNEFCVLHNIELSFMSSLHQNGLIEITTVKKTVFIEVEQLRHVEKLIRLYYDLDINIEGIQAITHLLRRMDSMQEEIMMLRNSLRVYELTE